MIMDAGTNSGKIWLEQMCQNGVGRKIFAWPGSVFYELDDELHP